MSSRFTLRRAVPSADGAATPPLPERFRLGLVTTVGVSIILVLSATTLALLAHNVTTRQERSLLDQRANEVRTMLQTALNDSATVLRGAGAAAVADGQSGLFETLTAPAALAGAEIVAAREQGGSFVTIARTGPGGSDLGSAVPDSAAAVARRALAAKGMVTGLVQAADGPRLVLALTAPGSKGAVVAYLNAPLPGPRSAPTDPDSPYRELDVALYAGTSRAADALVLVSGSTPPADGGTVLRAVPIGADTWLLAVSAREPLIGPFAAVFPWVVFGSGCALAWLFVVLTHVLMRRRDLAEERRLEAAREEILVALSHDLKAPLTAIQGFVELFPDVEEERRHEFLERVQSNAGRLTELIDRLIDHARLNAGGVRLSPEVLDLEAATAACLRDLGPVLGQHPVDVRGHDIRVFADAAALGRVLANLVINAAKYSPADAPIEISLEEAGSSARIVVTDHGRGIAAEDLPRIFDEFERGSLAERDGGTGLGLSSVRQLVALQGGRVALESQVGRGTTVTVELPRVPVGAGR